MRHKPLPPPPDRLRGVRDAWKAVPLVPGSVEDCCARLQRRLDLPSRDVAATWLAFLKGIGLADEGPSGFTRVREFPDEDAIARSFRSNVYAAREVIEVLAAAVEPIEAAAVAQQTADLGTGWERHRHGSDWPAIWRQRTADLLDWLVLLGCAEASQSGYRAARSD